MPLSIIVPLAAPEWTGRIQPVPCSVNIRTLCLSWKRIIHVRSLSILSIIRADLRRRRHVTGPVACAAPTPFFFDPARLYDTPPCFPPSAIEPALLSRPDLPQLLFSPSPLIVEEDRSCRPSPAAFVAFIPAPLVIGLFLCKERVYHCRGVCPFPGRERVELCMPVHCFSPRRPSSAPSFPFLCS